MTFFAAFLLPAIFWTGGPQTAPQLTATGVSSIVVAPDQLPAWKSQSSIAVSAQDPSGYEKLPAPGITFRSDVASATREPWVNSNGWRFLRKPDGRFFYDAPGPSAALAAAEAFTFKGDALIHTNAAGLQPLARMLKFLSTLPPGQYDPIVNIDFVDDGSPMSAECLNLLIRRNLLAEDTRSEQAQPHLQVVVLGSPAYPKKDAANPVVFAQQVRQHLTDQKRSLRIYGSSVVIGRLASDGQKTRVLLLNYGAGKYMVNGLRVRVLGHYTEAHLLDPDLSANKLADSLFNPDAAEFTLLNLKTFAVIELQ